jgi:hypothetical protein
MAPIDTGRFALGGLIAGLVVAAGDYVINNAIVARDWQEIAQRHNIDQVAMGSQNALIAMILIDLALGFVLVWTYVAIRPRFGPGPSTAIKAAVAVWAAATLTTSLFGGWFVPWDLVMKSGGLTLAAYLAGALAGASIYRE